MGNGRDLDRLFLMGTHSAFFGPGKYGVLPELFAKKDLAKANGLILMTTFLAIIFGTVAAGFLMTRIRDADKPLEVAQAIDKPIVAPEGKPDAEVSALHPSRLWIGSCICIAIAVLGTFTASWIRRARLLFPNPSSL